MSNLSGRYAIVTGGGKGIGAAIVKKFMEEQAAGVAILEYDFELAKKTAAEIGAALKMHEYRVGLYMKQARGAEPAMLRRAVTACQSADRALKRSAADGYGIIERLICSL